MKKVFKIFRILIVVLISLVILLSVIAKLKENEITTIALKRLSKSIKAPMEINDISFNLLRKFPWATIEFKDVWLGSPNISDSNKTVHDTLANIQRVYISVRSIPLFRGEFEIKQIEIKGVDFNYIVDPLGRSNFDFLKDTAQSNVPETDTSSINLDVILRSLLLEDVRCRYIDYNQQLSANLFISEAKVKGNIHESVYVGLAEADLKLSNCSFKKSKLNLMHETTAHMDLAYSGDTVQLQELKLFTDGASFNVSGSAVLKDTIETDIVLKGTEINLAELLKYVPEDMLKKAGLKKVLGTLNLDASIKGLVYQSILPNIDANVRLNNGAILSEDYPFLKNISFNGSLSNGKSRNNQTSSIFFRQFHAETQKSKLDMTFAIRNLDKPRYKVISNIQTDLSEIKPFIPDSLISDAKGHVQATISTNGQLPDSIDADFIDYILNTSKVELKFDSLFIAVDSKLSLDSLSGYLAYDSNHIIIKDVNLSIPSIPIKIKNTSFDIRYTGILSMLNNMRVNVDTYHIETDSCLIDGNAQVYNLENPDYRFTSNIMLNLNELNTIIPDTLVEYMGGIVNAQISSKGKLNLDSISSQLSALIFEQSEFNFDMNKLTLTMPDSLMSVSDFSGNIHMKQDTIEVSKTSGVYCGIDFGLDSTKVFNLYKAVIQNQATQVSVDGRFYLGELNYTFLLPFMKKDSSNSVSTTDEEQRSVEQDVLDNTESKQTHYTYSIKGKLEIKSVTYNNVYVNSISTLFNISDSLYLIDQFKFNAFNGSMNTSIRYTIQAGDKKEVWVKNKVEKMDISRLLKDFNNFEAYYQPQIGYENISGILSSTVDAQIFIEGPSFLREKLRVKGNVKLEKGGIYNYQHVQDMAKYLPWVNDLSVLEFKTLDCDVFIFKDAVCVPVTLMFSNRLDASILGSKDFDEDYSYHIKAFPSDLLIKKTNRRNAKQDAIGDAITETERKGGIPLRSYSMDGEGYNGPDNKAAREEMERKIKARERLLDVRFNPYVINYNTGVD